MKAALAIAGVMLGCCVNVIFLELLVKEDPGSGNLINFCQFVIISIEGFFFTLRCGTKKIAVPLREYLVLVVLFFVVSTANNMAFAFNISMTLHLIFRSGSLMANMILGMIIMGKRYTITKYLSITMISVGICICTIASSKDMENKSTTPIEGGFSDYFWWVVGITILTFALFTSARMGLFQEVLYKKYGKHPREALFFTHFLPLPGFALLITDLITHVGIANKSAPLDYFGFAIPCIWVYIAGNVLTQAVCINSVYVLTTECTSLTVTLVVTLRKFISLVISIFYFGNPFTVAHWLGTILVFAGTILYSDIPGLIQQSKKSAKKVD
ncbi:UDP-xylose and UDP-N-acetylglucosamine transporter [Folsomia candida]|uniref:UDP-xylose and UDP-N-acetylglucosamine transporter n=1 Tax=Folsomia candida TaxID=158441 RepID=A0A226E8M0_FOLCA|nr:UDP-xylose and UDP-N-acetylglucosamine transporter [Folsomia candida]OXA53211.1 UDP-xylose and UDP-N-acetylglucosamine transporter [Folsomia candida]